MRQLLNKLVEIEGLPFLSHPSHHHHWSVAPGTPPDKNVASKGFLCNLSTKIIHTGAKAAISFVFSRSASLLPTWSWNYCSLTEKRKTLYWILNHIEAVLAAKLQEELVFHSTSSPTCQSCCQSMERWLHGLAENGDEKKTAPPSNSDKSLPAFFRSRTFAWSFSSSGALQALQNSKRSWMPLQLEQKKQILSIGPAWPAHSSGPTSSFGFAGLLLAFPLAFTALSFGFAGLLAFPLAFTALSSPPFGFAGPLLGLAFDLDFAFAYCLFGAGSDPSSLRASTGLKTAMTKGKFRSNLLFRNRLDQEWLRMIDGLVVVAWQSLTYQI